jgi:hypothetical protein
MKPPPKIVVDVPLSEARRDRVEREVFARLDAMRDVDLVNEIAPTRGPVWRKLPMIAAGAVAIAAAASLVVVLAWSRPEPTVPPSTPSLVVTPVGGSSRFTVGDSVIDAGSDTSVEVKHEPGGGTTLLLTRGSVDCEVTPRPNRPPFRVIAGDVTVEVVGTRFAVSRAGTLTRVDVTRGKVSVHGNGERRLLGAGESWTNGAVVKPVETAAVPPAPAPTPERDAPIATAPIEDEPEIELPPEPARRKPSPKALYESALELQKTDHKQALRAFRALASGGHPKWAPLSLFNLAELQAKVDVDATLRTLDELARRFPKATNSEEAAWFRVDVLRDARRMDDARKAATDYLRDFPQGTYAKLATRLVRPSSP